MQFQTQATGRVLVGASRIGHFAQTRGCCLGQPQCLSKALTWEMPRGLHARPRYVRVQSLHCFSLKWPPLALLPHSDSGRGASKGRARVAAGGRARLCSWVRSVSTLPIAACRMLVGMSILVDMITRR